MTSIEKNENKTQEIKSKKFYIVEPDELAPQDLERLLVSKVDLVAIDHTLPLGSQIARSIQCGNFLHKCSVLSGLGCFVFGLMRNQTALKLTLGCASSSITCATLYGAFVQADPVSKYQIDETGEEARDIPSKYMPSLSSFVVLVRRDDTARKFLHNGLGLFSLWTCVRIAPQLFTNIYQSLKDLST
eukprot:m.176917 g.176917  ORF g.176917 m.176917 type:complete len:187 (-) comp15449_c0_seq3:3725-4285(-)